MLEGRVPSSGGLIKPIASDCAAIPDRTAMLHSRWTEAQGTRNQLGIEVVGLEVLVLLCGATS